MRFSIYASEPPEIIDQAISVMRRDGYYSMVHIPHSASIAPIELRCLASAMVAQLPFNSPAHAAYCLEIEDSSEAWSRVNTDSRTPYPYSLGMRAVRKILLS